MPTHTYGSCKTRHNALSLIQWMTNTPLRRWLLQSNASFAVNANTKLNSQSNNKRIKIRIVYMYRPKSKRSLHEVQVRLLLETECENEMLLLLVENDLNQSYEYELRKACCTATYLCCCLLVCLFSKCFCAEFETLLYVAVSIEHCWAHRTSPASTAHIL